MKTIYLPIILLCLLTMIFVPFLVNADEPTGLVTCNPTCTTDAQTGETSCTDQCTLCDFFKMLVNIYNFIVVGIATPLAVIGLIIGGIFIMLSAGNPGLNSTGKKIFWAAVIGLSLVFCSYIIIDLILNAVGYSQSWSSLNVSCPD